MPRENWKSRIVGHADVAPGELLGNPANFRKHPKHQQESLSGVLGEVGWIQQVIVNRRTGHLVDGHLRVSLALQRKESTVPVVYVDLDEAEERLALATFDPITALAETDKNALESLLREVSTGDAGVQAMLDQLAQDAGLVPKDEPPAASVDEIPSTYQVLVMCENEAGQSALLERLTEDGFECRALLS